MHDSHIHISMSPLKENIYSDIEEFILLNGKKILTQTTDITDYQDTFNMYLGLKKKYPSVLDFALGIHPSRFVYGTESNQLDGIDIFKYGEKQYDLFLDFFNQNFKEISAIGECGLDYYDMYQYNEFSKEQIENIKEVQRRVFKKLCILACSKNLPMSIHARGIQDDNECVNDTLTIIASEGKGILRGCFHSYTGSLKSLPKILDLGMYIGFNAIITYPSGGNVREILKQTPVERILFETDGPYLPTQGVRKNKKEGKRYGRPVLIKEIIEVASDLKGIPYEKVESISDNNYLTLFSK